MDDARLQELAERFYDRASAEHSRLPTSLNMEREFWTRLFLEFGRAVQRDTRDAGAGILTQISNLAMQHYERLPPRDKVFGIGRVLHAITELAKQPL